MTPNQLCNLLEAAVSEAGLEFGLGHGLTADYRTLYFTVIGKDGNEMTVSVQNSDGSTV